MPCLESVTTATVDIHSATKMTMMAPSILVPTMIIEDMGFICIHTTMNVITNFIADEATAHSLAVVESAEDEFLSTSTTDPRQIVEKIREANHCAKRGDLVSVMTG
mmetsp:Transcript_13122/g.24656  ORF Transcript_13122/g.24656 Transcript_13122/m.24656 type:complete len:106 (-) Transcript_13122:173-490(-)